MEHNLGELHETRSRELEQVQATVTAESARLQEQVGDLDRRIASLDESARRLESGLDKRLSQLSSDTVRGARSQLESALEAALAELSTRNAQELGNQLDEAKVDLQTIQQKIEASVSESLRMQIAETLRSFDRNTEEMAQQSVERWRFALAGALNSLASTLGEQFQLRVASNGNGEQHSR
jgi:chromosome segregation ATPase